MMVIHSIVVTGDHFQVLVSDSNQGPLVDTTHLWDSTMGVAQVPNVPHLIAIPIARYGGIISVELEILPTHDNMHDLLGWRCIGNFRIEVESGELILWGPEAENLDSAPRVPCEPGTYLGTAYSFGTNDVGDEFDHEGPDRYRIRIWKVA